MNEIGKDIFRAIHEGKWLQIEYKNRSDQLTKYWIAILSVDPEEMSMSVYGLHMGNCQLARLNKIYIESIQSSHVIEGSFEAKKEKLIYDIRVHPERYQRLFGNVANLKILTYLSECNRMEGTPYYTDYALLELFDDEMLRREYQTAQCFHLSKKQFAALVEDFGRKQKSSAYGAGKSGQYGSAGKQPPQIELGLNLLSIQTERGLYVLAYRRLLFDVKAACLRPAEDITICYEYRQLERKQSIRQFLDAEDYGLLDHFEENAEKIKDCISRRWPHTAKINDMPYLLAVGREQKVDLNTEYEAITQMYAEGEDKVTYPIRAFFGELTSRPVRRKEYPFALLNQKFNLDQLLAIYNAMKYPLAYVQGPPGTGKTSTIINTITTAFFSGRSVLLASYNNHPIDSVFDELCRLQSGRGRIPFPVVRLGNYEKTEEALEYIRRLYLEVKDIPIKEDTLSRSWRMEEGKRKELTALLRRYEECLELKDRREAMEKLEDTMSTHFHFYADIHDRQMRQLEKRQQQVGEPSLEAAKKLLPEDGRYLLNYFYFASARCIKRLDQEENAELKGIVFSEEEGRAAALNKYLSDPENMRRFLKIFPVVLTTCISAHRLGKPEPYFDMVIMDEASQCNLAVSLIPVLRGNSLMLVGDPQQLNPVITLDPQTNAQLRKMYGVTDEYDYIENSIYKTFLASDSVSDETLLSHHYRCHRKIIGFNNKKYYNNRLKIDSQIRSGQPLTYVELGESRSHLKNASPAEAEWIAEYAAANPEKRIGIITPFVNQKECIAQLLKDKKLENAVCGTVHSFQGDEKDVILFSLAITAQTGVGTYEWLKNNKELINVATSRAREQLVVLGDTENVERLHAKGQGEQDDLYELVQYVRNNGETVITPRDVQSRALGVKPYSSRTEEAFLESLNMALYNVLNGEGRCSIKKEVPIKQVFRENISGTELFYTGQFDFVVYQRDYENREIPILAIELDGKEHLESEAVRMRDRKKNEICRAQHFELIRVDNSYARRYYHIRNILTEYFRRAKR